MFACQRADGRTVKISNDFDAAVIAKDADGDIQNRGGRRSYKGKSCSTRGGRRLTRASVRDGWGAGQAPAREGAVPCFR